MSLLGVPTLSSFCSTPPPSWRTSPETLTGITPTSLCTPPRGWTVWPSGYTTSRHRLWAQLLHRRQQWAHADQSVQERQLQPGEWPDDHCRNLRGFFLPSSSTIRSKQQPACGSKHGSNVVAFRFSSQHWWTGARQQSCCTCWRIFVQREKRSRFEQCANFVGQANSPKINGTKSWICRSSRKCSSEKDCLKLKLIWESEDGNRKVQK